MMTYDTIQDMLNKVHDSDSNTIKNNQQKQMEKVERAKKEAEEEAKKMAMQEKKEKEKAKRAETNKQAIKHTGMTAMFNMDNTTRKNCLALLAKKYDIFPEYDFLTDEEFFTLLAKENSIPELTLIFSRATGKKYHYDYIVRFYEKINVEIKYEKKEVKKEKEGEVKLVEKLDYLEARHEFNKSIALKNEVKERDSHCCVCCGRHEDVISMEVHHKNCVSYFPELALDKDNLVTLCWECHQEFHSKYGRGRTKPVTGIEFQEWLDSKM